VAESAAEDTHGQPRRNVELAEHSAQEERGPDSGDHHDNQDTKDPFPTPGQRRDDSGTAPRHPRGCVPVATPSVILSTTQWRIPISGGIYVIDRYNGAYEKITPANFKLRVKIWY